VLRDSECKSFFGQVPTVVLEAVASADMWIWHAFFGMPGSHNDINILDASPLFKNLQNGIGPKCKYTINNHEYEMGYYLADLIYPDWATMVKTLTQPQELDQKQEAYRKDVERTFGVLQARFAIVARPARGWKHHNLVNIMKSCVILHNMIVKDEREGKFNFEYDTNENGVMTTVKVIRPVDMASPSNLAFEEFLSNYQAIRDVETHFQLRNDLIKHLWDLKGRSSE
jgi:hypothetical protein